MNMGGSATAKITRVGTSERGFRGVGSREELAVVPKWWSGGAPKCGGGRCHLGEEVLLSLSP